MEDTRDSSLQKSKEDTLVSSESNIVYIDEQRKNKVDLYLCCQDAIEGSDSVSIKKYAIEKAILACHSVVFSNMFTDCTSKDSEEIEEIILNENSKVTLTFLNIIYGKIDFTSNDFE
jgi:BTB/POZ domain